MMILKKKGFLYFFNYRDIRRRKERSEENHQNQQQNNHQNQQQSIGCFDFILLFFKNRYNEIINV